MVCGRITDSLWMDYERLGVVCGWIVEGWSVKPLGELGIIGYAGCPMREEIAEYEFVGLMGSSTLKRFCFFCSY